MARKEDILVRRRKKVDPTPIDPEAQAPSDGSRAVTRREQRDRARRRHKRRWWVRLLALMVLAVLAFEVWANWDVCNPEYVWSWLKLQATGGDAGDGFPTEIEGSSVISMGTVGNQLCVLTDHYLLMYNSTAGETVRRSCSYAQPSLSTAGNYALIAEIDGTRLRLETLSKTVVEVQTEQPIVAAVVSDSGSFAVVTRSTVYTSEVWGYSSSGKQQYHWCSASLLVMDVALSGNRMALIGTEASGGALQSSLLVMDITSENDPDRTTFSDALFYEVGFLKNGRIAAVGDTMTVLYDASKQTAQTTEYGDRQLLRYAIGQNSVGLLLGSYGSTSGGTLTVLNKNGSTSYSAVFTGSDRWLAPDSSDGYWLLSSENLLHFESNGTAKVCGSYADGLRVVAFGRKAIVLSLTRLEEASA